MEPRFRHSAAEGTTNLVNCTFTDNYASSLSGGGAIAQILGGTMNISNSIIWGNYARGGAQQFVVHASSLVINYSDYSNQPTTLQFRVAEASLQRITIFRYNLILQVKLIILLIPFRFLEHLPALMPVIAPIFLKVLI